MTESVQLALVGAACTLFGVCCTKGVDALIRWRKAESQMGSEIDAKLSARIIHLESEVARLQAEVASLQYRLGMSDARVELLQGRVDKAHIPGGESESQ